MAFSDSFLQELCDRNDVAEVVAEYVRLNKKSGANQFGLCPFHSEKTPSFSVNSDKQIYHCFGCGMGGTVISFIMEIENLEFRDAVAFLAKRAGITLPEDKSDPDAGRREKMLALNRDTARFFYESLKSASGSARARDYIEKRGISPAMVKTFGLGFAPDSWDNLTKAMNAKGYSAKDLSDAGLVRQGKDGRGVYDTFRNRLMFPVIDVRGSVIGFSGRILDDGEPKYMNSPETLVFNKSRNLFALNLAKKSKNGYIILSEGNIDVVALHQAGFDSAVASLGTSLTAEQAQLISRYKQEVVIAYDGDTSGIKAAQRAIGILEKLDLKVRVLSLKDAKDPDELIKSKGADAFQNLLDGSEGHIEYQLGKIKSDAVLDTDEGRIAFLHEATALLAQLPNPIEREVYAARVAELVHVSREAIELETSRLRKKMASAKKKKTDRELYSPTRSAQPKEKGLHYDDSGISRTEEGVVSLIYNDQELFKKGIDLKPEEFSNELLGRFYSELLRRTLADEPTSLSALSQRFSSAEISHLTALISKTVPSTDNERALHDYIEKIRTNKMHAEEIDLRAYASKKKETKGYGG